MLLDDPELALEYREYLSQSINGFLFMCFCDEHSPDILNQEAKNFINAEREALNEKTIVYNISVNGFVGNDCSLLVSNQEEKIHPEYAEALTQEMFGYSDEKLTCINHYLNKYFNFIWFYE